MARSFRGNLKKPGKALKEITRHIHQDVERELWTRAAGRCQFDGCNKLLYKSPLTQERVNLAEKAHIYSFSAHGPRGWGKTKRSQLNQLPNLMLVCHDCHHTIDQDSSGTKYSADLLKRWKAEHEKRIVIVTGVNPRKKSHVVLYKAGIGPQSTLLQEDDAKNSLFPEWYPAEEHSIHISMSWEGRDNNPAYWSTEAQNLKTALTRQIGPVLAAKEPPHFSVFGFAPIPLLIKLGSLFTDKVGAQVYQLHREPTQTWKWLENPGPLTFLVKRPPSFENPPALIMSLSDSIAQERITSVLGEVSIWELTIPQPNNDFLKSKEQLGQYREAVRNLIVEIGRAHGKSIPISIFPAIPVACAIELGRVRMPKADNVWAVYDQNPVQKKFVHALNIETDYE